MKKKALVIAVLVLASTAPAYANELPNLKGYVCIDQRGVHHSWRAAFDGTTFCKLVPNRFKK